MKLLITGSSGLVGRSLLRCCPSEYKLRALIRNPSQQRQLQKNHSAEFVAGDLTSINSLHAACESVDAIIHTAGLSSPWGSKQSFDLHNVVGTRNLLKAAEQAGVCRFVHLSSTSVYFGFSDGENLSEQDSLPTRFCNHYAASKFASEQKVANSPLDSVILRPRGIFGPHDRSIVPRLLGAVRQGKLWLPSARNPTVDLTYVDNVATAAIGAVDSKATGLFNITNGEPAPLRQLLRKLLDRVAPEVEIKSLPYRCMAPFAAACEKIYGALPKQPEPTLTRYSAALFHYHQYLDISAARQALGYSPKVSIDQGIESYGRWYESQVL